MATYTKRCKYSREILEEHCKQVTSFAGLMESFGLKPSGGNYTHFQKLCRHYSIDISHFKGKGWNKGLTRDDNSAVTAYAKANSLSVDEVLCENSRANTRAVRRAMLDAGIEYRCAIPGCDNTGTWLGKPLTLHVDHVNGVHGDNRLSNLRFLCPNCHQQTPTWGRGKMK